VPLAAAVELLHTASLIHDDINDHSDRRRGQPSVNVRWGDGLAVLVGDFVFKFLGLIAALDSSAIQVLADCCTSIVEGETLQMLHLGDTAMGEETYVRVAGLKTAALFAACGELGGVLAGASEHRVGALREYGRNLGSLSRSGTIRWT
jgi:geranylgeranyl pyrophosphate synthase